MNLRESSRLKLRRRGMREQASARGVWVLCLLFLLHTKHHLDREIDATAHTIYVRQMTVEENKWKNDRTSVP